MLRNLPKNVTLFSTTAPAHEDEIKRLKDVFASIPEDYLKLIAESSDTEFGWNDAKYLRVWSPSSCIEMTMAYHISDYLPDAFNFADDGGGGFLTWLVKDGKRAIYKLWLADPDIQEAVFVANSLYELLYEGKGLENI